MKENAPPSKQISGQNAPYGVILTRSKERAVSTLKRLEALEIPAISIPLSAPVLTGTPLPEEICDPEKPGDLVFTSPTAVSMAVQTLQNLHPDQSPTHIFSKKRAWCVGKKTAKLAEKAGFGTVHCANGALEQLGALLQSQKEFQSKRLHHLAPVHRAGQLSQFIKRNDIEVLTTAFYENRLISYNGSKLAEGLEKFENSAIFIYSERTGEHFFREIERIGEQRRLTTMNFISISRNAARCVPEYLHGRLEVSKLPQEEFMIEIALRQMQTWQQS